MDDRPNLGKLYLYTFIAVIIILLLYSFWGVISKGKIEIILDGDFTAQASILKEKQCQDSCLIKLPKGDYSLKLSKTGYQNKNIPVTLSAFQTLSISPKLQKTPTIETTQQYPEKTKAPQLILQKNKLIAQNDPLQQPIVIFSKPLKQASILTSSNYALIQSSTNTYLIDLQNSSRKALDINQKITEFITSPDGKYLLFKDKSTARLLNTKTMTTQTLPLDTPLQNLSFSSNEKLFFAVNQQYQTLSTDAFYTPINLLKANSETLLIGFYDISSKQYTKINTFDNTNATDLQISASGKNLYFKGPEEFFKIILE